MSAFTTVMIERIRENPCLYDPSNKSYKDIAKKAKIWEQIAEDVKITVPEIKKRWKSLRDNYIRYKREITDPTMKQAVAKWQRWHWVPHLLFLDVLMPDKEKTDTVPVIKVDISDEETLPDRSAPEATATDWTMAKFPAIEIKNPENLDSEPSPKRARQDCVIVNDIQIDKARDHDAIDHLFQSYAETFKTFSKHNQISLKVELANIFAQMEAKEMSEKPHDYIL